MTRKTMWQMLKQTFSEYSDDEVSTRSAAMAYYAMFAIAPLLVIAIAIAGWVFGEQAARGQVHAQAQQFVGENGARFLETMLAASRKSGGGLIATVISIAVLIIAATGVFSALQTALNAIWEVEPKASGVWSIARSRALGFIMVLIIAAVLVAALAANSVLAVLMKVTGLGAWAQLVSLGVQLVVFTVLVAAMYKVLPDARVRWKDVWIGAAITAVLFMAGNYLIGLYLGRGSVGSAFGAAGSLVAMLVWVYYVSQIFFLGAEFTQVYAKEQGTRIQPKPNAVRVHVEKQTLPEAHEGQPAPGPRGVERPVPVPAPAMAQQGRGSAARRIAPPLLVGVALGRLLLGKGKSKKAAGPKPPRKPRSFSLARLVEPGYASRARAAH